MAVPAEQKAIRSELPESPALRLSPAAMSQADPSGAEAAPAPDATDNSHRRQLDTSRARQYAHSAHPLASSAAPQDCRCRSATARERPPTAAAKAAAGGLLPRPPPATRR